MSNTVDKKAFEWLNGNQLSYDIWNNKYRYKGESFDLWLQRVSGGNAEIKRLIFEKKFLFGGRTLSNRGLGTASLNNCYSSGYVKDSLEDIMQVNKNIALTFKAEGGQGLSLSMIRPKGTLIKDRFESEGIVPFMEMFNKTTESIMQGSSRRGALMMSLDIWHKEAESFIKIKSDLNKINKANLSLEIDDEFMNIIDDYYTGDKPANYTTEVFRTYSNTRISYIIQPILLYKSLCRNACKYAEPGVLFTDRLRNYNMMEHIDSFQIETTNPCGEQPLPKNGACGLCSINLSEYVVNPFTESAYIDYDNLEKDIYTIVEAMDTIVDENMQFHALEEQKEVARKFRNLGIGIMGMHDLLIKMGIVYGSEECLQLVEKIMSFILKYSILGSSILAKVKGTFPEYSEKMLDSTIFKTIKWSKEELEYIKNNGLRNSTLLSIAPAGSIGTMLNVSTGIEPWYAMSYIRNTKSLGKEDKSFEVFAPIAVEAKKHNLEHVLVTSKDISWDKHIDVQAAAQKYVDTAISKTINMPKNTTPEDIERVYLYAWKSGLKGCTIYVDGSRDAILSTEDTPSPTNTSGITTTKAPKRPEVLEADFYTIKYKGDQFTVVVGLLEGKPYEIFAYQNNLEVNIKDHKGTITKVGKNHYKFTSEYITIKNLLLEFNNVEEKAATLYPSQLLRHGVEIKYIIKTMKKVNENIASFTSAICRVLSKYTPKEVTKETCPECGEKLIMEQGCCKCINCGFSRCG